MILSREQIDSAEARVDMCTSVLAPVQRVFRVARVERGES